MLAERVKEWPQGWEQEGFNKALKQARSAILREAERRFGTVPASTLRQIYELRSMDELIELSMRIATMIGLA